MALFNRIFAIQQYPLQSDRIRAALLYFVSITMLIAFIALQFIFQVDEDGTMRLVSILRGEDVLRWWWAYLGIGVLISILLATRFGRLWLAGRLLYWGIVSVVLGANLVTDFQSFDYIILALAMILGATFLGTWEYIVSASIALFLMTIVLVVTGPQAGMSAGNFTNELVATVGAMGVFVLLAAALQRLMLINRAEGESLADRERTKLADITTQIASQTSGRENLADVLNNTLSLLLESYPRIYHAQVFLLDDDGVRARLEASTGQAGQQLIEKGHSLPVGGRSVIGQCTERGEAVIARAGEEHSVHRHNELLPLTRVEAAFPLMVEGQIIGALDLQSREDLRLSDYDRLSFQSIADSLSLAIDNVRQFEKARQSVLENQRLAEQARNALREVERLNQRLMRKAWSEYLGGSGQEMGLNIEIETGEIEGDTRWTPTLAEAADQGHVVQEGNIVSLPLRVRDSIIGAMEFELPEDQDFTPEDMELVREVSERFGLAAENTRLVEESRRTAERESLISKIGERLQSATDIETTLTEAARSVQQSFAGARVTIRLGKPDETDAARNGHQEKSV